jgi:hypothetical protein
MYLHLPNFGFLGQINPYIINQIFCKEINITKYSMKCLLSICLLVAGEAEEERTYEKLKRISISTTSVKKFLFILNNQLDMRQGEQEPLSV